MAAVGRVQLYAMTGVVGPVYASKRLFTRLDFQSNKGLESANSGDPLNKKSPTPGRASSIWPLYLASWPNNQFSTFSEASLDKSRLFPTCIHPEVQGADRCLRLAFFLPTKGNNQPTLQVIGSNYAPAVHPPPLNRK
jgi:hypothetical protein